MNRPFLQIFHGRFVKRPYKNANKMHNDMISRRGGVPPPAIHDVRKREAERLPYKKMCKQGAP